MAVNIPLLPGGGGQAYRDAFELLVLPALRRYRPELIIVANGLDASAIDPVGRILLHSDSYRWMMARVKEVAVELCAGRVVVVHEGGYSEAYVPFCGQAVIEGLSDIRTEVTDPLLDYIKAKQPRAELVAFQRRLLEEQGR